VFFYFISYFFISVTRLVITTKNKNKLTHPYYAISQDGIYTTLNVFFLIFAMIYYQKIHHIWHLW